MPEIGQTISHYRITEKLGAGGMGEVYRAEDTVLGRQVAIKMLPDIFSGDPERMARFEREAKLLASLNHPNIATIHGLEQAEGKRFLVMELVEGETLALRIAKGPLPIDEALDICRQIAEGLEAAHEKGIVHRDLKPANVKITPEGKVKVLDFGLAKAFHEETSAPDASHSPTLTDQMTRPGVILGTAAYMSPEQAKGKAVDKRADIWAFGCILYESLTGERPFEGDTVTETLASILKGEPEWTLLPVDTPPFVRFVLKQCLQKDPSRRLRDIGDVRIEMGDSIAPPVGAAVLPRPLSSHRLVAWTGVAVVVGLLVGSGLMWYFRPKTSPPNVVRSIIRIEAGQSLAGMRSQYELGRPSRTAMAISNDARFIIYSAIEENPSPQARSRLFLRRIDQLEARPITGTEGGTSPFLSPDGRWVGFWADKQLKKVPIEGGVPTALCDVSMLFGASWGRDNSIVFADGQDSGLSRISAEGGKPEILTKPDAKREEWAHRLPSWLPDGNAVLFTIMRNASELRPRLALLRLDTREWHVLLQDAADGRYIPTGHLVFLRKGMLMAVKFDLTNLKVIGLPQAVVEEIMQAFSFNNNYNTAAGQFRISDTGSLIYVTGGIVPDMKNSLVWVDQKGNEQPVTDKKFPYFAPRLSPDGQRIAYTTISLESLVWVYDLSTGTNSAVTKEGGAIHTIWNHAGKRLLFGWLKSQVENIFSQPYDGSSPVERLTTSEYEQYPGSCSSDDKVAFVEWHPGNTGHDIAILDVRSGQVKPFLNSRFNERQPEFSPDGRWMAYTTDESQSNQIWVVSYPGPGPRVQVSSEGGGEPLWSRNGKQLFYRWQNQVLVLDIQTEVGVMSSKPRLLFEKPGYLLGSNARAYDLSSDGQRFLMVKLEQRTPTPVTEMIFVQNWAEELKRLVSTGK